MKLDINVCSIKSGMGEWSVEVFSIYWQWRNRSLFKLSKEGAYLYLDLCFIKFVNPRPKPWQ